MSVPTCDDEEVGDEAICHHPLAIPSAASFNLGGQPFVGLWGECVMGLPRLVENDCPHPLHVRGVRAIRTAHRSLPAHCEDAVHQFPQCTDQQPPVREKRSLLQLRVQLLPLLVHHQGLDGREVGDVGDDAAVAAGDHTGQLGEFLERRGTVQQVVWACQRVHGLKVHEDGAEGEDRGQPPDRELGVEGLAYGPRQQIGCPEVREVQVVDKSDDRDEGAAPHELPILPRLVSSQDDFAIGCLDEHRQAILIEVEVGAVPPHVQADLEGAEDVQRHAKGQRHRLDAWEVAEIPRACLHTMSADEMERDGILQAVLPFILLEIQRELCHLLRPQRLSIHAVRVIIESHDPINLLLVLRVVHDNLPSVHERIVQ
mmetsp:Transcript_135615/g.432806  ORF Transcript_135615/g.432806 Transcript_135615/m.432806 type:complete len:371 (+) Transcript_135615:826-1938(+)